MAEDQNDELKEDKELVKASAFKFIDQRRVETSGSLYKSEETLPTKHITPGGNPVSLDLNEIHLNRRKVNIFS